ncbi:hypothetical protein [Microbulbifer magnicolonia]|uniref:hypothetical protein n=1 Tax=Microbulbifer magnicolonia TaxID=3109744 RepID=UPI002B40D71C|nr:hypothetical protein [Microbulbifer sp. GG15]
MNKFKVFFTAIAFFWLWGCGFWAAFHYFSTGDIAWLGLLINAWALPVWMLLRYRWPLKYRGDLREPVAFAAVLAGLAIALLSDSEKGQPVYLAIYNLFILLIYLFHLSAFRHPDMPAVDASFPALVTAAGNSWNAAEYARLSDFAGLVLVFLRGSFCADSRAQLAQLPELLPALKKRGVGLVIITGEDPARCSSRLPKPPEFELLQLSAEAPANQPFIASGGVPMRLSSRLSAAIRPSQWLLDSEGFVLWRHLPANYRIPGDVEQLRGQLFRLED